MENQSYSFRSAFHGFHRGDVINFLQKLSAEHEAQLRERDEALRVARDELAEAQQALARAEEAPERPAPEQAEQIPESEASEEVICAMELEAYRRAERHEREAKVRAERLCADAAGTVEGVRAQLEHRQAVLENASDALQTDFAAVRSLLSEILGEINGAKDRLGAMECGPEDGQ